MEVLTELVAVVLVSGTALGLWELWRTWAA